MFHLFGVALLTVLPFSAAEDCRDLTGQWYNSLGSEMIVNHSTDGLLSGEYRTAVERSKGTAGTSHSIVIGAAPFDTPSATFGMAVLWRNGSSTTAWTGQCMVCEGGNETLVTSWLLRTVVDTCNDKWKSTYIGRDFFTREEQVTGPRKDDDTHTPGDVDNPESDAYKPPINGGDSHGGSVVVKRDTDEASNTCNLDGVWYNQQGSQINLELDINGTLIGKYRTAADIKGSADASSHSKIYGIANPFDSGKTWAMFVVWKKGGSVTGWVGQCHVCGSNKLVVLETGWLLRKQAEHCSDSWKSTLYGQSSFTREKHEVSGFHPSGEAGEDEEEDTLTSDRCNSAPDLHLSFFALIGFIFLFL